MSYISWSAAYFWHRVLCNLEDCFGTVTVTAWLDQAEVVALEDNRLTLREKSAFRREIISRRLIGPIQTFAEKEFGLALEVVLLAE